jgi:hypothetical protein
MLTPPPPPQRQPSYGTAKRLRHNNETSPADLVAMSTVACEQCGARFTIGHRLLSEDRALALRQVAWLEDRLVWDHIQERKHANSLRLPGGSDLNPRPPIHNE